MQNFSSFSLELMTSGTNIEIEAVLQIPALTETQ